MKAPRFLDGNAAEGLLRVEYSFRNPFACATI
jgi:hypothetical protein